MQDTDICVGGKLTKNKKKKDVEHYILKDCHKMYKKKTEQNYFRKWNLNLF